MPYQKRNSGRVGGLRCSARVGGGGGWGLQGGELCRGDDSDFSLKGVAGRRGQGSSGGVDGL